MFPNVYLFNPDYDIAMADFTPYYKSPAEIMRMIADLSVLPWWFAEEGNCVKVENMALVSLLQKQLREVCGGSMEVLYSLGMDTCLGASAQTGRSRRMLFAFGGSCQAFPFSLVSSALSGGIA